MGERALFLDPGKGIGPVTLPNRTRAGGKIANWQRNVGFPPLRGGHISQQENAPPLLNMGFQRTRVAVSHHDLFGDNFGRVAFVVDGTPSVVPVNHVVDGTDIVFRTSPHSELGRSMARGPVAFQIDDVDDFSQSGWSVLVQGSVEYDDVDTPLADDRPRPWAEGVRPLLVRIRPSRVSGRRLIGV